MATSQSDLHASMEQRALHASMKRGELHAVLVVFPVMSRPGYHTSNFDPSYDSEAIREGRFLAVYGWEWKLIVFNSDQDMAPFEVKSNWNYMGPEKAKASGKTAAKLLGIAIRHDAIASPHTTEQIEEDKLRAAWHDGTRIDGEPVGETAKHEQSKCPVFTERKA